MTKGITIKPSLVPRPSLVSVLAYHNWEPDYIRPPSDLKWNSF